MVEHDDAITRLKFGDISSSCRNHSSRFVTKNTRGSQKIVLDLLQVGVAHPAGLHPNEDFTGANFRRRDLIHRDDTLSPIDRSPHIPRHVRSYTCQETLPIESPPMRYAVANAAVRRTAR